MRCSATVIVVDDDHSVRESLPELLREVGYISRTYPSAEQFLASEDLQRADCLILDVAMPGMTGPELLLQLQKRHISTPIIFITALQNHVIRQSVLDEGAIACLIKPFGDKELLKAIERAISDSLRMPD